MQAGPEFKQMLYRDAINDTNKNALVNAVMNLRVPQNAGNFLTT